MYVLLGPYRTNHPMLFCCLGGTQGNPMKPREADSDVNVCTTAVVAEEVVDRLSGHNPTITAATQQDRIGCTVPLLHRPLSAESS